ncbi:hypothetical protein [Haloarcula pellucida]|uniref:Uncharacterized protein n=1 Tax=Haloarcula pellucida TaxID=1427151 RepID=A0A830GTD4_9EURY|nr:hypothetical protein [Halomicroarcula pellucida]MBX0350535.1 hypothetical protein [Halomicroarcula pellucida]GGO03768.1 hypothetical protein GCM10009030_39800 [Halomicroarcula pellucida]
MTTDSPGPIDPPKTDEMWMDGDVDVQPRSYKDLVVGIMEARDCSKPDAERFVDDRGREHAERVLLDRWSA